MEPGNQLNVSDAPLVDFDGVCQKIRAAVEPMRVHAVSLHDEEGDLLWLTESSMGPDEHNAVHQAFESFANGAGPTTVTFDLGDSRSAVLFRVTNAKRAMVGAVMVIVDSRAIKPGADGGSQLMSQKLLRALGDFAAMRRRAGPGPEPAPAPAPVVAATPAPIAMATGAAVTGAGRRAECAPDADANERDLPDDEASASGTPGGGAHPDCAHRQRNPLRRVPRREDRLRRLPRDPANRGRRRRNRRGPRRTKSRRKSIA
jgi:hypothetical protein